MTPELKTEILNLLRELIEGTQVNPPDGSGDDCGQSIYCSVGYPELIEAIEAKARETLKQ